MKHLIIIGAGGMGRCIFDMAKGCIGYGVEFDIKGFIDDNIHALDDFKNYSPIINTISNYKPVVNDVFVCSMGNMQTKKIICESLKAKGAVFQKLIHHTSVVGSNTLVGDGSVIAEYVVVSPDTVIGENSLVQSFAVVGHDCTVGDYVRIDTHCTCVGGTIIRDGATLHTSAVINHNVVVGENATVAACSFVIRKVKQGTTVIGNPAKILKF